MQQYQFNELDNRMSKLEKGQNVTKSAEEIAVEFDGEMPMDAELISKFINQEVAAAMSKKTKQYEKKIKTGERWKSQSVGRVGKKQYEGRWTRLQEKNPQLRRLRSQEQHRNLCLNYHKAKIASFRAPQG